MWNPDQYERFKAERKQPFVDLLALVERQPNMRVVDLGCGTGELTRELHETLHATETIGVDNSKEMLAKAKPSSDLHFELADIESYAPPHPPDLIFSNAALHWVRDHRTLVARLAGFLAPQGQIAIQMPANDSHASHSTAVQVAREFGVEPRHDPLLDIAEYASLLFDLGFKRQNVRMQIYGHEVESKESVIEWVKGTLLTDYEKRLGDRYNDFLAEYRTRLLARLSDSTPFFYTYKRVLILGQNRM